jgi:hypothetical protein
MPRVVVLLLSTAIFFAACSESAPAQKPLPICEIGTPGCSDIPAATKREKPSVPPRPPSGPTLPPPTEDAGRPSPPKDAGAADAAPANALGPSCTALGGCCDELFGQGLDATSCYETAFAGVEATCFNDHAQYFELGACQ